MTCDVQMAEFMNGSTNCGEDGGLEGYIGVTYLYHELSKQVIVRWIGKVGLDFDKKLKTQNFLQEVFEAACKVGNKNKTKVNVDLLASSQSTQVSPPGLIKIKQECSTTHQDQFQDQRKPTADTPGPDTEQSGSNFIEQHSRQRHEDVQTIDYLSDHCKQSIYFITSNSIAKNLICQLCKYKGSHEDELVQHVRQHYTKMVCSCGFSSSCHSAVVNHVKSSQHSPVVHEVDRDSFSGYADSSSVDSFLRCISPAGTSASPTPSEADTGVSLTNVDMFVSDYMHSHIHKLSSSSSYSGQSLLGHTELSNGDLNGQLRLTTETERRKQSNPVKLAGKKRSRCVYATQWISDQTWDKIKSAFRITKTNGNVCPECNRKAVTHSGIMRHIRQHFTKVFCQCGFQNFSRDIVAKHVQKFQHPTSIYEVDEASYLDWAKDVGLENPPSFGEHVFGPSKSAVISPLPISQPLDIKSDCEQFPNKGIPKTSDIDDVVNHSLQLSDPPKFNLDAEAHSDLQPHLYSTGQENGALSPDRSPPCSIVNMYESPDLVNPDILHSSPIQNGSTTSKTGRRKQRNPSKSLLRTRSRTYTIYRLSNETLEKINNASNESKMNDNVCPICNRKAVTHSGIKRHIKQHFIKVFCQCGFKSFSRDIVAKHVHKLQHPTAIYEVDEDSYLDWAKDVGLENPPSFGIHVFGPSKHASGHRKVSGSTEEDGICSNELCDADINNSAAREEFVLDTDVLLDNHSNNGNWSEIEFDDSKVRSEVNTPDFDMPLDLQD